MRKSIIHAAAGTTAMLLIGTFWLSTIISELFMSRAAIAVIKHTIVFYGLIPLVFLMIVAGAAGRAAGSGRHGRLVEGKKKRMPLIALNGLLVIIPCAIFLNGKAATGEFDPIFYAVQILELCAGATQLFMLGRNFGDGLRLTGRMRNRSPSG